MVTLAYRERRSGADDLNRQDSFGAIRGCMLCRIRLCLVEQHCLENAASVPFSPSVRVQHLTSNSINQKSRMPRGLTWTDCDPLLEP